MSDNQVIEYKVNEVDTVKLSPDIVRNYIVKGGGATDQEVTMFLQLCRYQRLNPFLKEAYLIKYGNAPATMVTGRDVFTKRAAENQHYNGMKSGVYVLDSNGQLQARDGSFYLPGEELVGAWAKIYRKDWEHPTEVHVKLDEYIGRKKDGSVNHQWSEKPATMIIKVAETQALRKAFPKDFQGMYDEAEMNVDLTERNVSEPQQQQEDIEPERRKMFASLEKLQDEGAITAEQSRGAREYLKVPKTMGSLKKAWSVVEDRIAETSAEKTPDEDVEDAQVVPEEEPELEDIY